MTQECEKNASRLKIRAYRSIQSLDFNVIAQAIFENGGVGGGYRAYGANMGHFIFFKGYGIHNGYRGLRYKDSIPPFEKWIIQYKGRFYLGSPRGRQVQLFSVWTAEAGDWVKKNVEKEKLNTIYNELLLRDWNELEDGDGYLNHNDDFVRKEIGNSKERWQLIHLVAWARKWRVVNFFSGNEDK